MNPGRFQLQACFFLILERGGGDQRPGFFLSRVLATLAESIFRVTNTLYFGAVVGSRSRFLLVVGYLKWFVSQRLPFSWHWPRTFGQMKMLFSNRELGHC